MDNTPLANRPMVADKPSNLGFYCSHSQLLSVSFKMKLPLLPYICRWQRPSGVDVMTVLQVDEDEEVTRGTGVTVLIRRSVFFHLYTVYGQMNVKLEIQTS